MSKNNSNNKKGTMSYDEYVEYLLGIYNNSKDKKWIDLNMLITGNIFMLKPTYYGTMGIDEDLVNDIYLDLRERIGI